MATRATSSRPAARRAVGGVEELVEAVGAAHRARIEGDELAGQAVALAKVGVDHVGREEIEVAGVGHEDQLVGRHALGEQGVATGLAEHDDTRRATIEQASSRLRGDDQRAKAQGADGDRHLGPQVAQLKDERAPLSRAVSSPGMPMVSGVDEAKTTSGRGRKRSGEARSGGEQHERGEAQWVREIVGVGHVQQHEIDAVDPVADDQPRAPRPGPPSLGRCEMLLTMVTWWPRCDEAPRELEASVCRGALAGGEVLMEVEDPHGSRGLVGAWAGPPAGARAGS